MINQDTIANESNKENNEKWPFISDHPYRISIIGGSGSGKTNALLNLMKEQDDIDKIYLYAKNLCEPKNKFLNVQIQWMTFIRILMTAIQPEKEKC